MQRTPKSSNPNNPMKAIIVSIVSLATLATAFPLRATEPTEPSEIIRIGTPQQEADALAGFNLGRSIGAKRALEGFPKPSLEYLDSIIKLTIPNESAAYKVGFKAGYIDGWEKRDGKPL